MQVIAPSGYYIGVRIREARADIVYNTYPEEWRQRYLAMSYRLRDPTIAWAYANKGAAHWKDLADLDTAGIFPDAARYGLAHGLIIGTGELAQRTLAGFARPDRAFTAAEVDWLQAAVRRIHQHARPDAVTFRELQALRLIAEGKPYAIAAHMLGISQSALRARLASARNRLNARTVAEALQQARSKNII